MTVLDLLANWPSWNKKTPEEILASPAWAMVVRYGDEEMRLRRCDTAPRDVIGLRISFDDEEHFLGLGKREQYPDLSLLWYEKKRLPDALILALIEKECCNLLQLLENGVRRQLKIIGLASPDERMDAQGFEVVDKKGNVVAFFSLSLSHMVKVAFGDIANVDVTHPLIRDMELPTKLQYASFVLGDDDVENLAAGDYLMLPERKNPVAAKWLPTGAPKDGRLYVLADEPYSLKFSNFADGMLPPIPEPNRLVLVKDDRVLAYGTIAKFGLEAAFAIEEVL